MPDPQPMKLDLLGLGQAIEQARAALVDSVIPRLEKTGLVLIAQIGTVGKGLIDELAKLSFTGSLSKRT